MHCNSISRIVDECMDEGKLGRRNAQHACNTYTVKCQHAERLNLAKTVSAAVNGRGHDQCGVQAEATFSGKFVGTTSSEDAGSLFDRKWTGCVKWIDQ